MTHRTLIPELPFVKNEVKTMLTNTFNPRIFSVIALIVVLTVLVGCGSSDVASSGNSSPAIIIPSPAETGTDPTAATPVLVGTPGALSGTFVARPLTNASLDEIKAVAMDFLLKNFGTNHETPSIVFAQFVTQEDLDNMEIDAPNFSSIETPPLAMVIFKGDLTPVRMLRAAAPGTPLPRGHYAALIFELWCGCATSVSVSPDGSMFKKALNDPSIPERKLPFVKMKRLGPEEKNVHYGGMMPTPGPTKTADGTKGGPEPTTTTRPAP